MEKWERLENESAAAFEAFKIYLELDGRSYVKVAEKLRKSETLVRRWAAFYDWKNRARAWDNALLKASRDRIAREFGRTLEEHWRRNNAILKCLEKVFSIKDLSKISWTAFTELYKAVSQQQLEIIDKLKAAPEQDNNLTIELVKVT